MKLRTSSGKRRKAEPELVTAATKAPHVYSNRHWAVRRIVGESMYPTFDEGQMIIARPVKSLRPNDVIIFKHRNMEKIKRIREIENGRLYVVGDNPRFSTDSRHFGMIKVDAVIGKVIWPRV